MNSMFLAASLPTSTLLALGALGACIIVAWSYANWRMAVKVAFLAVLVEGAIRKWVFPSGQELAYFLKDVFLFGAYLRFYFAPDPELRAYRLRVPGGIIFLLCALVSSAALNPNISSALLAAYGVKIYFMYVPLTFMMPFLFRNQQQLLRQATWYVLLGIPICALGFMQSRSSRFSVINTFASGMAETGAVGFGVGNQVRVTGTFSYITGHTTFVIIFFTLTVALLALRETTRKWLLIFVLMPMLVANALMGGSRASLLTMAFVGIGFAQAAMWGRLGTSRNFVMMLVAGAGLAAAGAVYFATETLAHFDARLRTASDTLSGRVVDHPLWALGFAYESGGMVGFGIGTAHPATAAIRSKLGIAPMRERVPAMDNEPGQVLAELGLLGFLAWYGLRLLLLWLNWTSFLRSPAGIIRVMCLAVVLINGPFMLMSVVYNHTASFFIFALSGFGLMPLVEPTVQRRFVPRGRSLPGMTVLPERRGRV
jgi:O-antigen ligase